MTEAEITYMKTFVTKQLILLLMEKENISVQEAVDTLYNSETFQKLSNTDTGLYFQSPRYVFDYLNEELKTGRIS